jgi:hypothetical protein
MDILTATIIGSLNPDFEKYKNSTLLKKNNKVIYNYELSITDSLKNQYLLNGEINSVEDIVFNEIKKLADLNDNWDGLGAKKVNAETINNAVNIIAAIPPSRLQYIDCDSIYASSFGTIIIDFRKDGNLFSLEISRKTIGYFIERNGKDEIIIDDLPLGNDSEETINKMCRDMSIIL